MPFSLYFHCSNQIQTRRGECCVSGQCSGPRIICRVDIRESIEKDVNPSPEDLPPPPDLTGDLIKVEDGIVRQGGFCDVFEGMVISTGEKVCHQVKRLGRYVSLFSGRDQMLQTTELERHRRPRCCSRSPRKAYGEADARSGADTAPPYCSSGGAR